MQRKFCLVKSVKSISLHWRTHAADVIDDGLRNVGIDDVMVDVSYRVAPVPEDIHTQKLLYGSYWTYTRINRKTVKGVLNSYCYIQSTFIIPGLGTAASF